MRSGYWGCWDYIVGPGSYPGAVRVMCVTPVNWQHDGVDWSDAGGVREHCTPLDPRDLVVDTLPVHVLDVCLAHGFNPMQAIERLD